MKCSILALLVSAAALAAAPAESELEKQFSQLKQQRDAAISAATAPINRQFQTGGEALLAKAIQSGDVDAQAKIRTELKILTTPDPKLETAEAILKSGTWQWHPGSPENEAYGTVMFLPDGKVSPSGSVGWINGWEMTGKNTFKVYTTGHTYWHFEYYPERHQAATIEDPESIGDRKYLVPFQKTRAEPEK